MGDHMHQLSFVLVARLCRHSNPDAIRERWPHHATGTHPVNTPLIILAALCVLLVSACTAKSTPTATPTVAPSPTPTIMPTVTPTSSPTPTPTPQPEKLMADAAQAVHDGDYEAALQNYKIVIGEAPSAQLVEQASLETA